MSVAHVLGGLRKISFGDTTMLNPEPKNMREGQLDPVSVLIVDGNPNKGADIELLAKTEVGLVNSLFFLKTDDDGKIKMCWISKFSFDDEGCIRASVDLSRGDSGGPVFAVLDDHIIRYAGCVSAGSPSHLDGNFISSVTGHEWTAISIFDSDSENSNDFKRKKIVRSVKGRTIEPNVELLRRMSQSFHDRLVGVWFVDESKDGDEVKFFDNPSDVVDYIKGLDDDKWKKDSEHFNQGKKKKKRTAVVESLERQVRNIHAMARRVFGDSRVVDDYMRDVRCGYIPNLTVEHNVVTFVPKAPLNTRLTSFDYFPPDDDE
jgi:hypothetical protein